MAAELAAARLFDESSFDARTANELLVYAGRLSRRGYVMNTLGNMAVRVRHPCEPEHGVVYTKHMGVSLEEMDIDNVVVTDVPDGRLLYGKKKPSVGHIMNRTILRLRPDVNAVVHVHPDDVIAYFTASGARELNYVSADTALILARPPLVLEPNINVELDAALLEDLVDRTNCIIMPNHGVTTVGRDLSEAYHRMTSTVAETRRIMLALQVAAHTGRQVTWVSPEAVQSMYDAAEAVVHGTPESPEKMGA